MREDLPVGRPSWSLRDAVAAMESAGVERLAITDPDGTFVGMVSESEIVRLDEILDETGG
ncbi:MAG: CBS domain-containing protein [Acidimicrobiia bacterium]|nr:CBS domain-containing protein [Acidimicrobiia bacterium]